MIMGYLPGFSKATSGYYKKQLKVTFAMVIFVCEPDE